jgi:small subunit ribosomal protein S9
MTNANLKIQTTGRRKAAIARIFLLPGSGLITVNDKPLEVYFSRATDQDLVKQPLRITNLEAKFDISANVNGGGITGQAEAVRLGISKALLVNDESLKSALRKAGLLTRDPRAKERKKYGQKGARKRFQWTKR